MGREVECRAVHLGVSGAVKAHYDSESVTLRGEIRADIPFASLSRVEAVDGVLFLDDTRLEVGADAPKWAEKILHPPTLIDKLGLKRGMSVALLGFVDRAFMGDLTCDTRLVEGKTYDAVLLRADDLADLGSLQHIKAYLSPKAMLWIVYPKGRKEITQSHVFAHGKGIGLVDVKVCKFDDRLTALKFLRRTR